MSRQSSNIGQQGLVRHLTGASKVRLNASEHANRVVFVEAELTNAAQTFKLPKAVGSGDEYRLIVRSVLTQDMIVNTTGADVMVGKSFIGNVTKASASTLALIISVYVATATDNTYTFNNTTTGAVDVGDEVFAKDVADGIWLVRIEASVASANGAGATGFTAETAST